MTHEYTSPVTGKKYKIYEPSPMIVGILYDNETETSTRLRLEIANLAKEIQVDAEALKRSDLDDKTRNEVRERLNDEHRRMQDMKYKLVAATKIKPKAMCEILRTFVDECADLDDKAIIRTLGKDLDLLFMTVQLLADNDSEKYNEGMHKATAFFRKSQATSGSTGNTV